MNRVYFLTSCHYNPSGPDFSPLCLVWIGNELDHTIVTGKVYRSYDLPKMLCLAYKISKERNFSITVLSVDPEIVKVYSKDRGPP
jgi:hypothetical protein